MTTEQLQAHRPDPAVPRPAEGLELIGGYEDSGFKVKPYLVRRADGQIVQLSYLLYLVAEVVDGERDLGQIADRVTSRFGRGVSPDNVRYLVENKLRPLGVVAASDGSSPKLARANPMFMLKFRLGLVPAGVVRAITAVFWPLFLPPVVFAALGSLVAFDVWLFFFHGGVGEGMRQVLYDPASFAVLGISLVWIAVTFHECGHATACRYGGAKPGVIGAGLYVIWPVFYCDVTDSYRLRKPGRLRTDLGGVYFDAIFALALVAAYFVTGFEPLLVFIVVMHLDVLDEFMPFLRFDGYYVVSDLTGVPDLFGRIKPILGSLIPGREPDRRVAELKPWVRVVVTVWVLTAIPALVFALGTLVFYAPRMFATAWDSLLVHSGKLSGAFGAGEILTVVLELIDIALLLIPVIGVTLLLAIIGRRLGDLGRGLHLRRRLEPEVSDEPDDLRYSLSRVFVPSRAAAAYARRLETGVRSLVGRLRGGGASPAGPTSPGGPPGGEGGKPVGGGRPASGEARPSPEELERRLVLSLRETVAGGFARVCVGSPKGRVGKSSIAYALAGSISHYTNMRVCLVEADCDFGSLRLLVPRSVPHSVVTLAEAAGEIRGLSDLRAYVAQHERMRLDVVLGPERQQEMARLEDLADAYARIDEVLSRFYDLVIYDLGLGFRDPVIRRVLSLSNELLFVTDSEVIPNAQLTDAIQYVEELGVDLRRMTLVLNHRLPAADESAATPQVRAAHANFLRRVTEIPYDASMSQLFNHRSFHIEDLQLATRLGILTTVAACLEGLREAKLGAGEGSGRVAPPAPVADAGQHGAPFARQPARQHTGKDGS